MVSQIDLASFTVLYVRLRLTCCEDFFYGHFCSRVLLLSVFVPGVQESLHFTHPLALGHLYTRENQSDLTIIIMWRLRAEERSTVSSMATTTSWKKPSLRTLRSSRHGRQTREEISSSESLPETSMSPWQKLAESPLLK